jgi:hypothetical protein
MPKTIDVPVRMNGIQFTSGFRVNYVRDEETDGLKRLLTATYVVAQIQPNGTVNTYPDQTENGSVRVELNGDTTIDDAAMEVSALALSQEGLDITRGDRPLPMILQPNDPDL